jgi:hypothetical protein
MGKSPTGTSESNDYEPEEEAPEVHPDQTDFDEHGTPETDDPDREERTTPPTGGAGGPSVAPVTMGAEEASEGDDPEDSPKDALTEECESQEAPDSEEPEHSEERDDTEHEDVDEDQEQYEADITVYTDPWDITGWDNEPDLRRLQEMFGDKITVDYDVLPARKIEKWESDTEMLTDDDPELPKSTVDSYRALTAAQEQGLSREYLRRLQIAALSEGRDIEGENILTELAEEVGLDADQLRDDMTNVEVEDPEPVEETPQMEVTVADIPHYWTESIEFGRVFGRIAGEGVRPEPTGRTIPQFVAEYEPVATAEVAEAFQLDRDQAVDELRQLGDVVPRDFGVGRFWFTA